MMKIKQFFAKKELKLRKKRLILMSCCIVAVIAGYVILTWPKKKAPEIPVVSVEKVGVEAPTADNGIGRFSFDILPLFNTIG